jgi:hypothetical protein
MMVALINNPKKFGDVSAPTKEEMEKVENKAINAVKASLLISGVDKH